jgi:type VI secretion system protein ImpL
MKIVLIAVLVILAILLIFGFVLVMDWPWWVGFFILLAFVGIGIGVVFLLKILMRRKEQMFVSQVIEQDEARIKAAQGKDKDELTEIQGKWKEAVEALRRSHLRKYGNPLYVLPWYMIIGESGSGKTTALNSAKLSSPFVEVTRTSGISGTKNCDWWFFEQAIVIDTAGRYAIPVDEGRDKEEWQRFMNLLVKYRRREPLNGLIVALSADKILESSRETLEEDGKTIRRRLDELMRVLGTKFPVYLLITKCDHIQGMTRFCNSLPDKSLDQPMGFINQDLSTGMDAFLEKAVSTIGERLRNLRLLLLHQSGAKGVDPELLLFPEEFENLKQGLGAFVKGAFMENPYQETPVLRGMYFSSGRQEGTPYSHFLKALGLIGEKEVLPGTSKGLFLHDFFANILPKDRGLLAPTKRAVEWSLFTRNLGLTAWIVFGIAMCGLLSFSFVKNIGTMRAIPHEFTKPILLQGDSAETMIKMERFNQAILNVEKQNSNWWLPRFGLKESIHVEESLKAEYCKQFQQGFLSPIDRQLKENLSRITASASDDVFGQYVSQIVRRVNLLKARLNNEDLEKLRKRPQPSFIAIASGSTQELDYQIRQKFGRQFLYYIYWRSDTAEISKEIDMLRAWLKDLLRMKGSSPQWVVSWVNKDGSIPPVALKDFWGGSLSAPGEVTIAPAFSKKGKEAIDSLLKEIEEALDEPSLMEKQRMEVDSYYRSNCFNAWQNFAANFPEGSRRLKGKMEWQQAAAKMASDDGPYFAFLHRMAVELEPVVTGENIPSWLQQVYQFQNVKNAGAVGKLVSKTTEEGKKYIDTIKQKLGRKIETTSLDAQLAAVKAYQDYHNALSSSAQAAASPSQLLQLASLTFSEDPASAKSPFLIGYGAASRLKAYLAGGAEGDGVAVKLIRGPLEFLWKFACIEAGCQLQSQWEKEVLAEAQGASAMQETEMLWGSQGLAWKFVKGAGAPFIGWKGGRGYYAKEALGGTIPFEKSFFSALGAGTGTRARTATAASQSQNYRVVISALPTDANADASIKPHKSLLELTCDAGNQSLENLNYPKNQTFNWAPETCSDVTLRVYAGNAVITKQYKGQQAFVDFLRDFPGGRHTFQADEFPQQKNELKRAGIKYIEINYRISGEQQTIIKNYQPVSGGPVSAGQGHSRSLRNITSCWD